MSPIKWFFAIFAVFVLAAPAPLAAIPQAITISGYLTDPDDEPSSGTHSMRVRFYEKQISTEVFHESDKLLTVEEGVFSAIINLPDNFLLLSEVWYQIGIDRELDGFEADDFFEDRIQITAVPFSLSGIPSESFETGFGMRTNLAGSNVSPYTLKTVVVMPFTTPPGGVRFNRLACRVYNNYMSLGIYDSNGDLVVRSQQFVTPGFWSGTLRVLYLAGELEPSANYYAAWCANNTDLPLFPVSSPVSLPTLGKIPNATPDGILPAHINLNLIQPIGDTVALSFNLFYVDPARSPLSMLSPQERAVRMESAK